MGEGTTDGAKWIIIVATAILSGWLINMPGTIAAKTLWADVINGEKMWKKNEMDESPRQFVKRHLEKEKTELEFNLDHLLHHPHFIIMTQTIFKHLVTA